MQPRRMTKHSSSFQFSDGVPRLGVCLDRSSDVWSFLGLAGIYGRNIVIFDYRLLKISDKCNRNNNPGEVSAKNHPSILR